MELGEFAERIVFGRTIAEKISAPGALTDFKPKKAPRGRLLAGLSNPGRPRGLEMHQGEGVSQPPSDHELDREDERGRLLHFLANHELLATELMALVLLKFPDAPKAFRRGVLVTLQEEQEHTKLYLDRMTELGVEFGSFPLSGHFWRVVEPMNSPMDFVSRLSLTFEQANLDYSRHFGQIFKRIGDDKTAQILNRIYEDEIGHVRHGLEWFRQWKDPGTSDWEAYQDSLQFPMSPQRARGPRCSFNREGRRSAGLSDDFIEQVELFRQSRGRPPAVRWFDPAAEEDLIGEKPSGKTRSRLRQLGKDLEYLLVFLAKQDDIQLVDRIPSTQFRRQLLLAGVELPEFVLRCNASRLQERKITAVEPWAWTPSNHKRAIALKQSTKTPFPEFGSTDTCLYRKSWAAEHLGNWLGMDSPDYFPNANVAGVMVEDASSLKQAMNEYRKLGHHNVLIKRDYGNSGRGQRRLSTNGSQSREDLAFSESLFDTGVTAVVEPELERLVDISFLWRIGHGADGEEPKARFCGWTRQLVNSGRRYQGTRLSRPFEDCDSELKRFILADACGRLHATVSWLQDRLVPLLVEHSFSGAFGVDAFVYRSAAGKLKIKPLVELNPRITMGHVALEVRKRLAAAVSAELRILSRREFTAIEPGLGDLPLRLSPDGRWQSGVVRLSDSQDEGAVLAPVVIVGDKAMQLLRNQ